MTNKIEEMFADPQPNSYPEEQDETFQGMKEAGLTPANLRGTLAGEYEVWLKAHEEADPSGILTGSK